MSMINRLVRAFESMSTVELGDQDRGGQWGEQYAEDIIDDGKNEYYISNPIIPHPRKRGLFLESDFLVYTHGILYCVEIKNFRGKVYYPTIYRTVSVKKGWFIFKRTVTQSVVDGYDDSKMVQEKRGHNSQGIIRREMPNPLVKTQRYIDDLKRYLNHLDPRLAKLRIYPALGFAEKTDISAIYNFDAGIMHISQLPKFFEKYSDPAFEKSSAAWIQQALHRVPTWDRIWTTGNEMLNGVFADPTLDFKDTSGRKYSFPYAQLLSIDLGREGLFSGHDTMTITFKNGSQRTFQSVGGEIRLTRFQGEMQTHKLRNVNKLLVGIANK